MWGDLKMNILDKIVEARKVQLLKEKDALSIPEILKELDRRVKEPEFEYRFSKALKNPTGNIGIIAEVKKASPSKGLISEDFDPIKVAEKYYNAKVECASVLTEENYFLGNNGYLEKIHFTFPDLPILRKDFLFDEYQIYHAKYLGTSAILLIAAILSEKQLTQFHKIATELGMDALVEVHDKDELNKVLNSVGGDLKLLGINNRDLKSFNTNISNTEKLIKYVPSDVFVVSESGIKTRADVQRLEECGAGAVLVGETLMRSKCVEEKINELSG